MNEGGIFCGNFWHARGPFVPCKGAWCSGCYTPLGNKRFKVRKSVDDDGIEIVKAGDEKRFLEARPGDNLLTPFQCELCHFRNIMKRNPVNANWADREILEYIRRANLDAFWARETNTVNNNLRDAVRMESKISGRLGLPSVTPPMGPFPLEDKFGMAAAIATLDRSLDPGIYEEHVQWDTFRKVRSAVTNISQAGVSGLGDVVGAYERERVWISNVPTHSFWYSRFMVGLHKRVGEVRKPDRALTIDEVHAIERILEAEWKIAMSIQAKKKAAEMGVWFIVQFCVAIRGEEILLIEFAGTKKSLKYLRATTDPHFKLVVTGRTKGNQVSGSKFAIPCVTRTEGTGLEPGKWIERLIAVLTQMGIKDGPLFRRNLRPTRLVEYQDDFFRVIEAVQATTGLIGEEICVRDDYGTERTLRRSATAHAKNMGLSDDVVKANNRWRSEFNSRTGGSSRVDMIDVYTTLDALLPTVLRFSRAF
jgi:hypothetical protein